MSTLTYMPFGFQGKIFRSPMPYGPYDPQAESLKSFVQNSVSLVVVLTEAEEWRSEAGQDLPELYQEHSIEMIHFPIIDYGTPDQAGITNLLNLVEQKAQSGLNIAVHCLAGIGRTGLFMALLARKTKYPDPNEAIQWVRMQIPGAIETRGQMDFVRQFSFDE